MDEMARGAKVAAVFLLGFNEREPHMFESTRGWAARIRAALHQPERRPDLFTYQKSKPGISIMFLSCEPM